MRDRWKRSGISAVHLSDSGYVSVLSKYIDLARYREHGRGDVGRVMSAFFHAALRVHTREISRDPRPDTTIVSRTRNEHVHTYTSRSHARYTHTCARIIDVHPFRFESPRARYYLNRCKSTRALGHLWRYTLFQINIGKGGTKNVRCLSRHTTFPSHRSHGSAYVYRALSTTRHTVVRAGLFAVPVYTLCVRAETFHTIGPLLLIR